MTGLGTSQRRSADDGRRRTDGSAPERQRSWQLWPPEISWDPGPLAARARAAAAGLTPAALWRNHRLFTIVACVSVIPRVIAALGFKPALFIQDSFSYMQEGTHFNLGAAAAGRVSHCCCGCSSRSTACCSSPRCST